MMFLHTLRLAGDLSFYYAFAGFFAASFGGTPMPLALVWPAALKWVYIAWMKIGGVLGKINTTIILGLAYWLIFTPLGVVLRLIGKDTLAKGWREDVQTYRVPKSARADDHMERQF